MKKLTLSLVALVALVILSLILPMKATAGRGWAVGEWRLLQYFTQDDGREVSFSGLLRIHREGDGFHGRIYFDAVGNWEPLVNIEVTDETIRFTRPMYEQKFRGHRSGDRMKGTYRDRIHHGEWTWRAERD
jgi:hypothetical protein